MPKHEDCSHCTHGERCTAILITADGRSVYRCTKDRKQGGSLCEYHFIQTYIRYRYNDPDVYEFIGGASSFPEGFSECIKGLTKQDYEL